MIEIQGLSKHFGPVRALDGIDLTIGMDQDSKLVLGLQWADQAGGGDKAHEKG